jgi:O-antigen/teichoic acid export membrane protein
MSPQETNLPQSVIPASKYDQYFRTDHLKSNLGSRSARSGVITAGAQALKFIIILLSTSVLGRLLRPEDYGLINMVAALIAFSLIFKYMGLSSATVQRPELSHQQVSNLFWLNVSVSCLVGLLTILCAPAISRFYHEPRLTLITVVSGIALMIGGLGVQHSALLNRQMRVTAIATIDLSSLGCGIVIAIILAWYGAGYWALVFNQLGIEIAFTAGAWIACGWRPGLPSKNSGVRPMLQFGRNLTAFNIIYYFSRNLDNVLIGRYWGAQQLGLYAKAYQIFLLPMENINYPINAVAVPVLSRLTDEPERYRQVYLRILEKLAMLTMPGVALMMLTSDWLVRIILGPQWNEAARIFSLLAIAGLTQPIAKTTGWLLTTQNRTHHLLQWGLIGGSISIASIIIGLPWGGIGVATSYSLMNLCLREPFLFWFVGRSGPVRTSDFYRTIAPAIFASIAVMIVLYVFRQQVGWSNPYTGLLVATGLAAGVSLAFFFSVSKSRRALWDFKNMLMLLKQRESASL